MMSICTSRGSRDNADLAGFGWRWDSDYYYPQDGFVGAPVSSDPGTPVRKEYGGIPGDGSNTCSFRPMLGLFMQNQYIPLMWGGLTLEFEIVSDALEPIITPDTTGR